MCTTKRTVKLLKMSKAQLLSIYKQDVNYLRQKAKELHMSDDNIDKLFEESFRALDDSKSVNHNLKFKQFTSVLFFIVKLLFFFLITCLIIFILLNHHPPTLSLVLRNVQSFIYPSLKLLRLAAIPIITIFPSLSELYDETCLIENPYFQVTNMECWPCENVNSVVDLTGFRNYSMYQSGIPYIIKTLDKQITLHDVQELYKNNSDVFNRDAQRIKSNNRNFSRAEDLLNFHSNNSDTHILWRINRMTPARIMRTIFPRPYIYSPWSGQSTERFLIIDDLKANPYVLPNPECAYVLLTQGFGQRTIILKPSKECSGQCRTISVVLKPSYSLWYNWWYWRPISLPTDNSTDISISYISSYC